MDVGGGVDREEFGQTHTYYSERTPVRQRECFDAKLAELRRSYPDCVIVSCGYGRHNFDSLKTITELAALATGLEHVAPGTQIALDIGGQDTKTIRQIHGKVREFFINDKCAAGSGMFLTNVLHTLGIPFEDIELCETDVKLSATCAVFAQTEIVGLIADGVTPEDIVSATLRLLFLQGRVLLEKLGSSASVALCGGLTQIQGIRPFAERWLERSIILPDQAQYLAALGCALMACGDIGVGASQIMPSPH
jgi:predicted CoA-substrate-specific enzyme activase